MKFNVYEMLALTIDTEITRKPLNTFKDNTRESLNIIALNIHRL